MFEEIDLDRRLRLALDTLALDTPSDVQRAVVPAALEGVDLKVCAPTGSGKTLAYLLPLLENLLRKPASRQAGTLVLVLVPTRELARQVLKQCRDLIAHSTLQVSALTGGADFKYQKALLRKNPEILVATPGRLLEHCQKGSADLKSLRCLVLDEADRMLDMGFRDDVLAINNFCGEQRQALLLSATLRVKGLRDLSSDLLNSPREILVGEERRANTGIHHQRILADSQDHKDKLLLKLFDSAEPRRSLVFANKRVTATRLAGLLGHHGLRADALHGDMSTEERKRVVAAFREGKIHILCASDLAARGLDIADIDTVVNYDLPHSGDDYIHRCGRTARAGANGLAISLVEASQWNLMISIQRYLNLEFEQRAIAGLKARYQGPKKLKASGKAASGKRKGEKKTAAKDKQRHRDRKQKGRRKSTAATRASAPANDGTGPLLRRNKD